MKCRDQILAAWDEILALVADGVPPLRICKERGWNWATFDRVANEGERGGLYARAREAGWRALADECLTIADDGSNDTYTDEDGRVRTDHDVIARSKLRVDTRKWLLSKMLPKVYGDQKANALSDGVQTVADLVRLVEGRRGPKVFDVKAGPVEALPEGGGDDDK